MALRYVEKSVKIRLDCLSVPRKLRKKLSTLKKRPQRLWNIVLSFLYLREYEDDGHIVPFQSFSLHIDISNSISSEDELKNSLASKAVASNNIRVFTAADKLAIDPLKSLAAQKSSRWTIANWNSIIFPELLKKPWLWFLLMNQNSKR